MITATTTTASGATIEPDFSWSYSRIKNFETCPRRYHEIDVLKNFKEPKGPELAEGFAVHDAMAKAVKGAPLPPQMPYGHWIHYVHSKGGTPWPEIKLAITSTFEKCDYFDKVKKVWLRTVADTLSVDGSKAHIVDWKTGKVKPDLEQLILIATCLMVHYPKVIDIQADLVWLSVDAKTTMTCNVDDLAKYWRDTMFGKVDKLKQAHATNDFPPTRSGLCKRWCVVTSCEYCGQ